MFHCPRIDATPRNWPAVEAAFAAIPTLPLRQAWREPRQPEFRPARAALAHSPDALCAFITLEDDDVFNPVTGFNQPAFLQGDVVELFILPQGMERYCEIHATPQGALLQLRLPTGWRQMSPPPFQGNAWDQTIATPVSEVLARTDPGGWSAFLAIPFELLGAFPQAGATWRAAVCRYDYTQGRPEPILSSTATFLRLDFHQTESWNRLVFTYGLRKNEDLQELSW